MKRLPTLAALTVLTIGLATPAWAQPAAAPAAPAPVDPQAWPAEVVFGVRLNSTPTMGRFMRFDDLRSGPTVERFRLSRERDAWMFRADLRNVGYRDQRYGAEF